jgi:hypothetical protein
MSSGSAAPKVINEATSMRRNSSNDSEEAEQSDPQNWFDHSNENPSATADNNIMNSKGCIYSNEEEKNSGDTDAKM